MYKPNSLRAHLTAANPDLQQNPEKLLIFADEGHIVATGTGSLSFEYRYTLQLILTDYSGSEDAIMVPLLAWVAVHQVELLGNADLRKTGISFEVDFNNHSTIDLSIKLALTEKVRVTGQDTGRLDIAHVGEAIATPDYAQPYWTLYAGNDLLAEWHTPKAVS